MIPSQIFCCHFQDQNNGELEVRALEMSPDYFSFRLSRKRDGEIMKMQHFPAKLIFYRQEKLRENRWKELEKRSTKNPRNSGDFQEVSVADYRITKTAEEEFWTEYRFETSDPAYRMEASRLLKEYGTYIRLKLEKTDEEMARVLTGYPVDETKISKTFAEQKTAWAEGLEKNGGFLEILASHCEIGIALNEPELWEAYRDSESWNGFVEWYCRNRMLGEAPEKTSEKKSGKNPEKNPEMSPGKNRVQEMQNGFGHDFYHWLAERCRYLYVGNSFCPHLYPDSDTLQKLRERAERDRKTIVYVFSTMSEHIIPTYRERLEELKRKPAADLQESRCTANRRDDGNKQSQMGEPDRPDTGSRAGTAKGDERSGDIADGRPEIVVNDAGMLSMLRENGETRFFHITYGVIPIRRRKDPRIMWKKEPERWKIHRTTVNDGAFLRKIQDSGIERLSFETCGYVPELPQNSREESPGGNVTVYFPYYQMNTSTWCTTYAMCQNGKRGRQEEAECCPGYCRWETFLYPDDLHMVGRFNSLFGLDREAMENGDRIRDLVRQGADRIVLNFL